MNTWGGSNIAINAEEFIIPSTKAICQTMSGNFLSIFFNKKTDRNEAITPKSNTKPSMNEPAPPSANADDDPDRSADPTYKKHSQ